MPGYYPMMQREPVAMAQVYPPARSYSLAKLNVPQKHRDYGLYEKVKVDNKSGHGGGDRQPHRKFEQLRRQQSYDSDMISRMMYQGQPRRAEGFDSLKLLGAHNDDRYLDRFMDSSRGRPSGRDMIEQPNKNSSSNKNTLLSTKSSISKNSGNSNGKNNKENKKSLNIGGNVSNEILALIGSLANNSQSVDNIYESVEQIHYRKSVENMKRREKVRSINRTGHPLFDHLREERAMAGPDEAIYSTNTISSTNSKPRVSPSTGPSRKISTISTPAYYSSNSSGDEQDTSTRINNRRNASGIPASASAANLRYYNPQQYEKTPAAPAWRRTGSAGSESDEEWVIPRPKFGGRKREARTHSTDESDSSSKSNPMR